MAMRVAQGKMRFYHLMAHSRNPPIDAKILQISYADRVIVNFVPNFATGIGRAEIYMTPLDSLGRKIGRSANSAQLSFKGAELWQILSQISLPWQWQSIRGKYK